MKNYFKLKLLMFLFVTPFIFNSCSTDNEEADLSGDTLGIDNITAVEQENQKLLSNNSDLIQNADGLLVLPVNDYGSSDIITKSTQMISAIVMANNVCSGSASGYTYKVFATASNIKPFDRKVKVALTRDSNPSFPFYIRDVTIPAGASISNFRYFNYSNISIGWTTTGVLEVSPVVSSTPVLSLIKNPTPPEVDLTNYVFGTFTVNIQTCDTTQPDEDNPWTDPNGGGGYYESPDPCDCDGDGLYNWEDGDDNNNGFPDLYETNFNGCSGIVTCTW